MKAVLMLWLGGVLCIVPCGAAAQEATGRAIAPTVVITGAKSCVRQQKCHRITSSEAWAQAWQAHKGASSRDTYDTFHDELTLPTVDFSGYMVLAVFEGESVNCAGLVVHSLREETDRIVLRIRYKYYQTNQFIESESDREAAFAGNAVTPYGFFIVPRSNKPVVVQVDTHTMKGDAPIWKDLTRFPPLNGSGDTTAGTAKGTRNR